MKKLYLMSLFIFCFSACSEDAQPYEEVNRSIPGSQERGYIETH